MTDQNRYFCAKSVDGDQLAQVLNECLSLEYGVREDSLIAAIRDGASMNQAALNHIQFTFPKTFNVVCFSHTLDNVGNHFVIPNLTEFGNLWVRLFSQSHKVGLMWKELTGGKPKHYSETRGGPDGKCTNSLWNNLVMYNNL